MAQQVRALPTKCDDLGSILKTYEVEEENTFLQVVLKQGLQSSGLPVKGLALAANTTAWPQHLCW